MKKLSIIGYLLAVCCLLFTVSAQATTYYVRPGGSDSHNCTQAQTNNDANAKATIFGGLSCRTTAAGDGAGHIVQVAAGSYNIGETLNQINVGTEFFPKGSSWAAPFTLKCETVRACTLVGGAGGVGSGGFTFLIWSATSANYYAVIDGFVWNLANGGRGMRLGSASGDVNFFRFSNNTLSAPVIEGIHIGSGTLGSHDNEIVSNIFANGQYDDSGGVGGNYAYPIYLDETRNNLIDGNEFYNFPSFGIHINPSNTDRNTNNIVKNNYLHNFSACNPNSNNPAGGHAIILNHAGGNLIYNNIINCGGAGISERISGTLTPNVIVNNTIYATTNNLSGFAAVETAAAGNSPATVRNNLIANITGNPFGSYTGTTTNNLCPSAGSGCSQTGNPLFVSPGTDFHLQSASSPAVNTGLNLGSPYNIDKDGISRPASGAWEMGAFEFVSSVSVVINAISPNTNTTCSGLGAPGTKSCTISGTANNIITLSGSSTQSGGSIVWACIDGRCTGSGTATGTTSWTTSTITLKSGTNVIAVTGTGGASDTITVTFAPTFPGNTAVLLLGFEDGSGTSATDSSGNGNTGTLTNGVAWTTNGRFGKAVSLDGINDYVNVTDANSLHLTQSWTISAYVQPITSFTTFKAIVHKNASPSDSIASGYELYASIAAFGSCTSGGIAALTNTNGTSGPRFSTCTNNPLQTNVWTHLAATYDNATAQLKLYRNGVLINTTTASGYIEPSIGSLQIGASEFGEQFQGLIDEVRVYNFPLPLTAGSNTVAGASCTVANWLANTDVNTASIIGNMNCPIINLSPPSQFKISAGATQMKVFSSTTGIKIGANP